VRGRECYLHQAIDRGGQRLDTLLRKHRCMAAALTFFRSVKYVIGVTLNQVNTNGRSSYEAAAA
jgi:transposase-like protein